MSEAKKTPAEVWKILPTKHKIISVVAAALVLGFFGVFAVVQFWGLTPARDLTGTWKGEFTSGWSPNSVNDIWYTDHYDVEWKVTQSGNTIAGYVTTTYVKRSGEYADKYVVGRPKVGEVHSSYLTGTVEGSKITINFDPDFPLTGSFTADIITAKWEGEHREPAVPGGPTVLPAYLSFKLSLSRVW